LHVKFSNHLSRMRRNAADLLNKKTTYRHYSEKTSRKY
jgi:hypothetical protein